MNYDDSALPLPPTMPSGKYRVTLSLSVRASDDAIAARDALGRGLGSEIEITSIQVTKNKGSFTASELWIEQRYYVDMDEMRLLGFKPIPQSAHAGETIQVGLYWRARGKPKGDYLVVVQFRDENGRVAIEHAARPANDTYPTTEWNTGEVLLDWHDLVLPPDTTAGTFEIVVLMKERSSARVLGETVIDKIQVLR